MPVNVAAGGAGRGEGDPVLDGDLVGVGSDGDLGGLARVREADLDALPADHDRAARAARWADTATARRLSEQAVQFARQLGTDRLLIESLATASTAYYLAGEEERQRPVAREAVERARQLGDDVLLAESLSAYLKDTLIDLADIKGLFAEAIAATQRSGDHLRTCILTNNAGVYALLAGDIPAARAYLEQAAEAIQATGEEDLTTPINMGWVLRQEHDPVGARSSFQATLRISRRTGHRVFIANASLGLACLAADDGGWHRAATLHGVAQAALERAGQRWQELETRVLPGSWPDHSLRVRRREPDGERLVAPGSGQHVRLGSCPDPRRR